MTFSPKKPTLLCCKSTGDDQICLSAERAARQEAGIPWCLANLSERPRQCWSSLDNLPHWLQCCWQCMLRILIRVYLWFPWSSDRMSVWILQILSCQYIGCHAEISPQTVCHHTTQHHMRLLIRIWISEIYSHKSKEASNISEWSWAVLSQAINTNGEISWRLKGFYSLNRSNVHSLEGV